ncbi:MAG: DUF2934 domain-containing protein [Gammaproteobacteria bacterium]|nr:DUF2934 domain-containing protein [Gammaproteobacteria bacterium]
MANTSKTTVRSKTTVTQKPPKAVATARKSRPATKTSEISLEHRQEMVAEAAYLRAEQRGFGPGDPVEDWLAAEREVDLLLAEHTTPVTQ